MWQSSGLSRLCPKWRIYYRTTTGQTVDIQSAATNLFQIMESCIIVVLQQGFTVCHCLVYYGMCFISGWYICIFYLIWHCNFKLFLRWAKRNNVWNHFDAIEDGKAQRKLCRANTWCSGGSTNWRVFKRIGYLGTRFNTHRVPGFLNSRKSEH